MGVLLWLGLHVMGNHEPVTVDLLVDVRHQPIDLAAAAVAHLRLPYLCANFPGEVADGMDMGVNQLDAASHEGLIEFGPIFFLRLPTDDDGRVARADVGYLGLVRPDFLHGAAIVDHHDRGIKGPAGCLDRLDVGGGFGARRAGGNNDQQWQQYLSGAPVHVRAHR